MTGVVTPHSHVRVVHLASDQSVSYAIRSQYLERAILATRPTGYILGDAGDGDTERGVFPETHGQCLDKDDTLVRMDRKLLLALGAGAGTMALGLLVSRFTHGKISLPGGVGVIQDPEAGTNLITVDRGPGPALVLYTDQTTGAGTFRVTAESAANLLGAEEGLARDGQGLLDAIDRAPYDLTRTIAAGHGSPRSFLRPGTSGLRVGPDALPRWVSVQTFVQHLAPKISRQEFILSFAGCRAGANPNEANWSAQSDVAGGERSLAAQIRDEIVRQVGTIPNGEVRAKSTTGTSYGNPMGRSFPIRADQVGRPGIPLIDQVWGPGSSTNAELNSRWRSLGRRRPKTVMGWTLGSDVPRVTRPTLTRAA